ncbi:MAG: leucine-rich repeat domain-containing protein, partial [Micrococcales bacterium]|nr:leucine-rich repeat domain-containing protein [Micrococcales bacterium]
TDTEAESLTSLDCSSLGITDLTGLEAFVNLQILRLSDNLIIDVGPLTGLASLQELYLDSNQIQDLPDMSAMTGLTVLNLDSNQVTDVSPLAGLMSLILLDLTGNQVTDVSSLTGLVGSTLFYLAYNQITDLSPLGGSASLIAEAHDQAPAGFTTQVGKPLALYTITHHDGSEILGSITPGTFTVTSAPTVTAGAADTMVAMPNSTVVFNAPGVYTFTWSQPVLPGGQPLFSGAHTIVVTAGPPPPPPPPPPVPNPPPPNRVGAQGGTGAHPWTGTDSRPMVALALALLVTGVALRVSRRTHHQPAHRAS